MKDEYLRRNLAVAKSYGVRAGMELILSRISKYKNPPVWMTIVLKREIEKMDGVIESSIAHRDEVKP